MNLVTEDKVVLPSVGAVIDTKTGDVFDIMADDTTNLIVRNGSQVYIHLINQLWTGH